MSEKWKIKYKSVCASNKRKYENLVRQSVGNLIARYVWSIACMYECIYYAFELQMQCIMRRYIIHTPPITQCTVCRAPTSPAYMWCTCHWLRVSFLTGSCQDTVLLFNIILTLYQVSIVTLAS